MKVKAILVVLILVSGGVWAAEGQAPKGRVRIYLPRTRSQSDPLTLGSIGVVRSDDPELKKRVEAIAMGRAPRARETIVISRRTVLARLAAVGIASKRADLTGAAKVEITSSARVVTSDELLEAARSYLNAKRPGPVGSGWRLVGKMRDVVVPAGKDVQLTVTLAPKPPAGHVKLEVQVRRGAVKLGVREALFKLTHLHRQAVTTRRISAGELITTDNARIEMVSRDRPADPTWTSPLGMEATRDLRGGVVLRGALIRQRKLAKIIKRNQPVTMVVRGQGFVVSAKARALQDGRPGEFIRVQSTRSGQIIIVQVGHDGTVTPAT